VIIWGGERGGAGNIKKKKNKRGIRNYPIPVNYNRKPIPLGPIAGIHFQPSNLTLEEYMQTDEYKEFIHARDTLSKEEYIEFIKNRGTNGS
jgi:hypothetical protein